MWMSLYKNFSCLSTLQLHFHINRCRFGALAETTGADILMGEQSHVRGCQPNWLGTTGMQFLETGQQFSTAKSEYNAVIKVTATDYLRCNPLDK